MVRNPVEEHFFFGFFDLMASLSVPFPYGAELMIDGAAVSTGELPRELGPSEPAVWARISHLFYDTLGIMYLRQSLSAQRQ